MATDRVVKSACNLCAASCGILVTLEGDKVIRVKGDPEAPPNFGSLCPIGLSSLEYLYHPDRLKRPLKRVGQRGEGNWQPISWEEAFSSTAEALNKVKRDYGPEGVAMVHGSAKGYMDTHLVRLANSFGTPNVVCSDNVCHVPRMLASEITFGFLPSAEYAYPPACIVVWGCNPAATRFLVNKGILQALKKGSKLIIIDPMKTELAEKADLWLKVKPGSDLALALGMINVIINEELYDKDFVAKWTLGFDELKAHVQDYPLNRVAEMTWLPAELIIKAARLYAGNQPGHIESGNAFDNTVDSFQAGRALAILMALTGNLGLPGGEIEALDSEFRDGTSTDSAGWLLGRWSPQLELRDRISTKERRNKIGADLGILPDFRYVLPQSFTKSALEGEPYRIRAAYVQASNPLSSWPNIQRTFQAFKKLDFLAVSDLFMTPTAALADIVFPVASYLECDGIVMPPMGRWARVQRKVAQIGECRSDHEIINGLAKKLGRKDDFWESIDDFWDAVVRPIGLTYEEFKKKDWLAADEGQPKQYKQYQQNGFRTPSGKVELYSSQLEAWGLKPLPACFEPGERPHSEPEMDSEYPLLCTNRKAAVYRHSGGRQIPSLRNHHPDPIVLIHPETAGKLNIAEGDWAFIETRTAKIEHKAQLSDKVDRRVVVLDNGWWFPEREKSELFGWSASNYNVLTSDEPFNHEIGSFVIRGLACKVYKATSVKR